MDNDNKKQDGVKHYVCDGGCKGVSLEEDASCKTVDCLKNGYPLQRCYCSDQKHEEVLMKKD